MEWDKAREVERILWKHQVWENDEVVNLPNESKQNLNNRGRKPLETIVGEHG